MARAVVRLAVTPTLVLVDGNRAPPLGCATRCLVGGDARSLSIAAASILAKTVRDRAMARLEPRWPGYGFAAHKGYPTAAHRAALARLGPCPHHRRGFRPVDAARG
jgi:ribonuclease HII